MSRYRQNHQIAWRRIRGEAVLLDPLKGVVFVLNGVGSHIWEILEEPRPEVEITHTLVRELGVDETRVASDVTHFLHELTTRGLIEVCP